MHGGHLGTLHKCPDYRDILIFRSFNMIKCHLGPQLSVWIMQVSLFSSAHINKFHCVQVPFVLVSIIQYNHIINISYCTLLYRDIYSYCVYYTSNQNQNFTMNKTIVGIML